MKNIVKSFVAVAAMAFAGVAWGHTQKIGAYTWNYELYAEGGWISAEIRGVTPVKSATLEIPSELNGYPVRSIRGNAFYDQDWTGVSIPNTVTNIGPYAFYGCGYLTGNLTIPASVVKIGNYAFAGCNGFTSLTLKEGVKTIGERAFWACSSLTSVKVPDSVTSIGSEAFMSCSKLKKVDVLGSTFDGSLTKDSNAFSGCADGFSLSFRDTVGAFTWYYTLNSSGKATIERGGERAVTPMDSAVNLEVPSKLNGHDVISIGESALNYCTKLTSVVVPAGVISLGDNAFYSCPKLTTVTLPSTCTIVGKQAFAQCTSLASIDLSNICVYGDYVFSGCTALKKVTLPDSIVTVLPVFGFGEKVFSGCTGLTEATLPLGLCATSIDNHTFSDCSSTLVQKFVGKVTASGVEFTIVYIRGDGIQIGDGVNAAIDVATASAVSIPYRMEIPGISGSLPVRYIADNAFKNCKKITSVTIGGNVREIGASAFYGCSAISSVNIPNSVQKIHAHAFMDCTSLESINIPDTVVSCGQKAFSGCVNLKSAAIGDGLTAISNGMFENCEKLNYLLISYSKVKSIYPYAFSGCKSLKSVVLPDTVEYIGAQAFAYCDGLLRVMMKRSLYDNGCDATAFKGDSAKLELQFEMTDDGGSSWVDGRIWYYTISMNRTSIGWGKEPNFAGVDPMPTSGTLTIPETLGGFGVSGINEKAFSGAIGITKVVFPSIVRTIGPRAFWSCSGLTELTLPDNLETIGANAFTGCTGLTAVTIPDGVTSLGEMAFSGCTNLKKASLPKAVYSNQWGADIFPACADDLEVVYRWDDGALRQWVNNAAWLFKVNGSNAEIIGASSLVAERVVPSKLGGYSVTSIADNAFSGKNLLTNLTIPEGVVTIGKNVFDSCTKLVDVTIPESVTSIGEGAFNGCSLLEGVYLNGNITKIAPNTFYNCTSLATVAWTYNVTQVGAYAFYGCSSLTGFGFGTKLTTIGQYAFAGCTDLSGIYVQDSTTSIADYAFANCSSLMTASLPGALAGVIDEWRVFNNCPSSLKITYRMAEGEFAESIYDVTWRYKLTDGDTKATVTGVIFSGYKGGLVIPSTLGGKPVTAIADNAFVGKTGLGGIRIPGTVKTVGKSAFAGCKLGVATFDDGVTSIGERAFENCTELVTVDVIDSVTTLGDYAFSGCSKLTTASLDDDHIGALERHVFDGCSSKLVVTFRTSGDPLLAQKVGDYFWFYRIESAYAWIGRDGACAAVPAPSGDLTIPDSLGGYSVVGIKQDAFKNCTGITGLELPYNLEKIEQGAFEGCTGLTSVTFPDKVSSIADYAFKNCTSLTSVSLPGGFSLGSHVFDGCPAGLTITYRGGVSGSGAAESGGYTWSYRVVDGKAEIWNDDACAVSPALSGTVTIPSSLGGYAVAKIGKYAFKNCSGLARVTIPAGVTEIGYGAFNGCTALTYVSVPSSVETIGGFTFNGCTSLGSITLPEGLKTIGHHAFQGCSNLRDAPIPESVTRIEERAFSSCGFTTVVIPDSVTSIGQEVFYGCRGVTRIELNSQIAVDESYWLFGSDRELVAADLVIASGVTKIPDLAFLDYKKIKSVTIPDTVTSIGRMAFEDCEALTSITIPDSVTEIGDSAFAFCWALAEVTLPAHLTVISEHLLDYCPIESITIPDGVIEIKDYAFSSCTLTNAVIPNSVTTIGEYAFQYNDYLEEMTIPRSVTSIGEYAFKYCNALATVRVEKGDVARVKNMFLATGLDAAFVDGINFVEPLPDYYIVSFNANGGTASETVYQREPDAALGELPTADREGYTLVGWFTAAEGVSQITAETKATEDVTYYAHWTIKKYTITFNANGGDAVAPWSVDHGAMLCDIDPLPETTRAGYVFECWLTEGGDPVDEYSPVTADATLVAQWAKVIEIELWNVKDGVVEDNWYSKRGGVVSGYSLDLGTAEMDGYVFLGWSYTPAGEIMPPNSVIVPTDDLDKLYAQFALDTWTVTFNANGGLCDTPSVRVAKGGTLDALPAATREGFALRGWFTAANGGEEASAGATVIDSDVTFYAQWQNVSTTEAVIPDGATEIASGAFSWYSGLTTVTIPSSVTTIGAAAFEGCTSLATVNVGYGDTDRIKALLIASGLDAAFVNGLTFVEGPAPKHTVTFDANGGDVYPESIEVDEGSAIGAELPTPTYAGFRFTGWSDGLGGTVDAATVVTADMTCTAQWEAIVYCTVTLNPGEGSLPDGAPNAISVENGDKVGELPVPERENYRFTGWLNGSTPVDKDFVVTADATFNASWEEIVIPKDFTVTFNVNGGTLTGDASITVTEGQKVGTALPTAVRTGYEFVGWKTSESVWVTADTVVTSDIACTAEWDPNQYTVTLNANGGVFSPSTSSMYIFSVFFDQPYGAELRTPTYEGYTFAGWFTAQEGGELVEASTVVKRAENHTLYAHWTSGGGGGGEGGDEPTYGFEPVGDYTYYFKVVGGKATIFKQDPNFFGESGTVAIEPSPVGELTIPETLGGYPVVGIAYCAFMNCDQLTGVTIPAGVTTIDSYAFSGCTALKRLAIPASLTTVGTYPFQQAPIKVVYVGSETEKERVLDMLASCGVLVGNVVFIDTTGPHYTVTFDSASAAGVITREYYEGEPIGVLPEMERPGYTFNAWYDNYDLRYRVTEDFVVTGDVTFYARWTVTESVQTAEANGYVWTYMLDGKNAIIYNNGNAAVSPAPKGHIDVPAKLGSASVVGIGDYAFYGCDEMTSVKIPDSVKTIGKQAFAYCSSMECVDCGKNLATIGSAAFSDCDILAAVQFRGTKAPVADTLKDDLFDGSTPAECTLYVNKSAKDWPMTTWQGRPVKREDYMVNVPADLLYPEDTAKYCKSLTGAGNYALGKKVTLKATENSGAVFAGWYDRNWELVSRTASFTYTVTGEEVAFYAYFVSVQDDIDALSLELDGVEISTDENGVFLDDIMDWIISYSEPKITFKGLPTGLKFDNKTYAITGKATKPGIYTVTVSLANKSVKKALTATFTITVPNFTDPMLVLYDSYEYIPGVSYVEPFPEAAGWSVSGLPSGMKWTAKAVTDKTLGAIDANSVYGAPSKPGYYTVYFTKTVDKVKHTVTTTFNVLPFRKLVVNYDGDGLGKATGAGDYPANKKVSLKATPISGNVFQGWYTADGELISQAASYSYVMPEEDTTIYAYFITSQQDKEGIVFDFNEGEVVFDKDSPTKYEKTIPCGVYLEWPLAVEALSLPTVKVSGLPTGLKFTAKPVTSKVGTGKDAVIVTNVPANTIYGTPTAASKEGKPSNIKITITTAGKTTVDYTFVTVVSAMEDWAVGTFSGGGENSMLTLTVAASGKVSGKYIADGVTWTLSAANFTDYVEGAEYIGYVTGKSGKAEFTERLIVQWMDYGLGYAYIGSDDFLGFLYQTKWKDEPWKSVAKTFAGERTLAVEDKEGRPGTLKFKFTTSGAVTIKGEFTGLDGKAYSASASADLAPTSALESTGFEALVHVYFPPKANKFSGFVKTVNLIWDKSTGFSIP